jgi:hypothetical protein
MLTRLPNGTHADLTTATIIQVGEKIDPNATGGVTKDRVIIKWGGSQNSYRESFSECVIVNCDSLEEAQAEADRLAAIANNSNSGGTVLINDTCYRASDVLSANIVEFPRCWGCTIDLAGDRRQSVWFETAKDISGDEFTHAKKACEAKAHEYARTLMAQVAGAERGGQ